jgi:hypothetical protein
MKMESSNAAAVWLKCLVLPVVELERRIVLLIDCFICMVVLVLRITFDQAVLLQTVLNFVA